METVVFAWLWAESGRGFLSGRGWKMYSTAVAQFHFVRDRNDATHCLPRTAAGRQAAILLTISPLPDCRDWWATSAVQCTAVCGNTNTRRFKPINLTPSPHCYYCGGSEHDYMELAGTNGMLGVSIASEKTFYKANYFDFPWTDFPWLIRYNTHHCKPLGLQMENDKNLPCIFNCSFAHSCATKDGFPLKVERFFSNTFK